MYELFLILAGIFFGYSLLCLIFYIISQLKENLFDFKITTSFYVLIFFVLFIIFLTIAHGIRYQ